MSRNIVKTTVAIVAILGMSILARAAEPTQQIQAQVKLLQSASLDDTGTFKFAYPGCEGHYGRVSISSDEDEGSGLSSYLHAIRIRVYDVANSRDACKKKLIEGSARLKDVIRNAPDLRGATFQSNVPIKLPKIGLRMTDSD
jgi:hypothetical protein